MWNIKKQKIRLIISAFLLLIVGLAQAGFSSHPFASILLGSSILITPPKVEWERTFGSEYDDIGHSVQQTCDGGYIVTGMIGSDDGGPGDIYLFKTDASGNLVWEKRFGRVGIPGDDDAGRSVQQTTDGGYIVAGWTGVGIDNEDAYFLKTDASGNIEWDNRFGGAACEQFFSVQQTKDGGYIATGWTGSFGYGREDAYLVKTCALGKITWQKTFGSSDCEYGRSVQQTSDGGYIIVGDAYLGGGCTSHVYLIKTDSSGNLVWEKIFGDKYDVSHGHSVQQTTDGGYILAGAYGILIKTDAFGNILWERTFSGDHAYSVQQTRDGGYIAAGQAWWGGAGLLKTDASGNLVWEKVLGDSYTFAHCVQQTKDGGYILTGGTWGGGSDVYLAKLSPDRPETIYVDTDANGLNDGSSWENAYNYLQDALAVAFAGDEIWIAQGVYKPDQGGGKTPGDRAATFQLKNGVAICGGYAGLGQPDPNNRNIDLYKTILSGDLDGNDVDVNDPCDLLTEPTRAENSYNVVTGYQTDTMDITTDVLDGFTIADGNANGPSYPHNCGGGMLCRSDSTVRNCMFTGNSASYGGGMYTVYSEPTLTNCTFSGNAAECGGAMVNGNSNPMLTNCTFSENTGGGMVNWRSSPTLSNCTFSANSAGYDCGGGAMHNEYSNPMLTNCTFRGNSAEYGGGMYNNETEPTLTNCLFIGNSADYGGGMYSEWCSRPTLTNCTFSGNSAVSGGGGMYNYDVIPTLTNCTFTGNLAANGGGMWNGAAGGLRLINCTFTGNFASSGGGIYNSVSVGYPMEFPLTNCILWGSSDSSGGGESAQIHGGAPVVNYSCIHGWTGNFGGTGNISDDPCFVEPGYWDPNGTPEDANDDFWVDGDYHLKSQAGRWDANEGRWTKDDVTSLCIDAGDPNYPIGLEPFPNGGIINMGAYGGTEEASKSYFDKPVCETIVAGDINGDCEVNFKDFALMAFHWLEEH